MDEEGLKEKYTELDIQREKLHPSASAPTTYLGQSTQVKDPLTAMQSDSNSKRLQASSIIDEYKKSLPKGTTTAAIENSINDYINGNNGKGNKSAIPAEWRGKIDQVIQNREDADAIDKSIATEKEKILNTPDEKAEQIEINNLVSNSPGVIVHMNGTPVPFTNKELYDYSSKLQKANLASASGYGSQPDTKIGGIPDINFSGFTKKEIDLYNYLQTPSTYENADEKSVALNTLGKYADISNYGLQFEEDVRKKLTANLASKNGAYIPQVSVLPADDEKSRRHIEDVVGLALNQFNDPNGTPGASEELSSGDIKNLQKLIATKSPDRDALQYRKVTQGDKTFIAVQHGSTENLIPLTNDLAAQLPKALNEPSYEDKRLKTRYELNDGYTNPEDDPKKSYFKTSDFPNVKQLSVAADLSQDKSSPGFNYVTLRLKCPSYPSGWVHVKLSDNPMDLSNVRSNVLSLTDDQIKEYFMKYGPKDAKDKIKKL